ncbi:MAG: hypothetical protein WCQ26_03945 [Pseudanabaena sp. ELA748]
MNSKSISLIQIPEGYFVQEVLAQLPNIGDIRHSSRSLKIYSQVYRSFKQIFGLLTQKFATHCVANLSWTHVRLIMRLDNSSRNRADFGHFYSKKLLNGIVSVEK